MKDVIYILLATTLTASASTLAGNALLRSLRAKLYRSESLFLGFVLGSGCLAALTCAMALAGVARRGAFFAAAAVIIGLSVWRGGHQLPAARSEDPTPRWWKLAFWAVYLVFGSVYLSVALAPEASLDGNSHYLVSVARWRHQFGFAPGELQQAAPGGVDMLFLFAFAIGRHSAAAMVELLFTLALPFGILSYARRIGGDARAGVLAALLFFASPVVGFTGSIAAPDVAVACVAFACFYLADIAFTERQWRLLGPLAALLGFLAWVATPWLARELNPPFPHLNPWSARMLLDLAVHGAGVGSILGAVFLLLPLAVLALVTFRRAAAWRLWAAALAFSAPGLLAITKGAMETRLLIPALPFFSLILALTLVEFRMAAPAVLIAHVIMGWPSVIATYADRKVSYVNGSEWPAALRIEHEDHYLLRALPGFYTGLRMEKMVPDGARILTISPFQQIYHTRILVLPESAEGRRLREVFQAAMLDGRVPVGRSAIAALKKAGIGWVLVKFDEPGAVDLLRHFAEWDLQVRSIDEGHLVFQLE